jgi:hypothetical protein
MVALETLEEASQALGKGRGSGSGLARLLRRAAEALEEPVGICLEGCWPLEESGKRPHCIVAEALERIKNSMQGLAVRLQGIDKLQSEVEVELASMLIDLLYTLIEGICKLSTHLPD